MNENPWNEVVQAYEKHFDCLEAAREEYRKAVQKVIDELKNQAFPQNQKETDEFEIKVAQQPNGDNFGNFGKTSVTWEVRSGLSDDQDYIQWATITARIGKPWEGKDGTIQLKLEMEGDRGPMLGSKWPWKDLRDNGYGAISSRPEPKTEEFPLSDDDFTEQAQKGLSKLVSEAKDRAGELTPAIEPIQKFDRVMKLVNGKQRGGFGKFNEKLIRYKSICVQTNSIPSSSSIPRPFYFWFALHLRELTLLYGFNTLESRPDLPKDVAEKLGCKLVTNMMPDSAELMSKNDFTRQKDEAIADRCLEALQRFIELAS